MTCLTFGKSCEQLEVELIAGPPRDYEQTGGEGPFDALFSCRESLTRMRLMPEVS